MTAHRRTPQRPATRLATLALAAAALLAGCGGGGGSEDTPPLACSVADQQAWLQTEFNDWYFWYAISPNPPASSFSTVDGFFNALLFTGSPPTFPPDRWSYYQSTESFNRTFGDGQTLGYGVRVAGLETDGDATQPLYIRYIDPGSPAATAGLARGDELLSINGTSAASLITAGDFSALAPADEGDTVTLRVRTGAGATRDLTLTASIFDLTPVPRTFVQTSPGGRRVGYVLIDLMVSQVNAPLDAAFSNFVAAGVQEVVLDLRYNGGGLVSVASDVGAYVGGARTAGAVFSRLLYNDKQAAANNTNFLFGNPAAALGLGRVYVLTGPRTCSASEQVINALRPFVDVVTVGDTTCGKPVGFLPQSYCGQTYSIVKFESVNAASEGRYFDGFNASCPVAENFTRPMAGSGDPLWQAALTHADTGTCPVVVAGSAARALKAPAQRPLRRGVEPGERQGMIAR